MSLRYPLGGRIAGNTAGWLAWLLLRALFLFPDRLLARLFGLQAWTAIRLAGESPLSRALADLAFVFRRDPAGARIFRRLVTESPAAEMVGIVRGAVLRSLS